AMTATYPTLTTLHDPHADKAQEYRRAMEAAVADLKTQIDTAARGGTDRMREKHRARGKLLPRQRVERLLDPGTPFLELSPLAAPSCPCTTRCSPTRSTSAASSTTRPRCRGWASPRSPASWGCAPPAAPTCRPCPTSR